MKIAVMVLGILGGLASLGLGGKWISDYNKYSDTIASLSKTAKEMGAENEAMGELKAVRNGGYSLLVLGLVGIVVAVMIGKLGGKVTGGVLLVAGIVPLIFTFKALLGTLLLLIGGGLAFLVKDGGGGGAAEG